MTLSSSCFLTVPVFLASLLVQLSECYPNGAPDQACCQLTPSHSGRPQTSSAPYLVRVSATNYVISGNITVTLDTSTGRGFEGFLLQARLNGTTSTVGQFNTPSGSQRACQGSSVTHTSSNLKTSMAFTWSAPSTSMGDIVFVATFVKDYYTCWVSVSSSVVKATTATTTTSATTSTTTTTSKTTTTSPTSTTKITKPTTTTMTPTSTTTTTPSTTTTTTTTKTPKPTTTTMMTTTSTTTTPSTTTTTTKTATPTTTTLASTTTTPTTTSTHRTCKTCDTGCGTGDCIEYDTTQQSYCTEVTAEDPTFNCTWYQYGLARHADQIALGGTIVAYKLLWWSGKWTDWYVPGVNDIDCKYTIPPGTCNGLPGCGQALRRMWSYFYDHTHTYIICYNHW